MKQLFDVAVVGGGFAGIYSAWRLARSGKRVALVEAADFIGGNLKSREWEGYWLDNGTHNFDLRTKIGEDFYTDILGDDILIFEDQQWACTTGSSWTEGFEMPDLSAHDPGLCERALSELAAISRTKPLGKGFAGYIDYYRQNYGDTLTNALIPMMKKYTGSDPHEFAVEARTALGMFSRPKLGSDDEMINLKETGSFWDDRLGVSLMSGDDRFSGKSVNKRCAYPKQYGLNGFCLSAHKRLIDLGVEIFLSSPVTDIKHRNGGLTVTAGENSISCGQLFWSLPDIVLVKVLGIDVDLMKSAIPVGTCFFGFEVHEKDILGPDYLQDYSTDRLPFRYNRQGVYSNQTRDDGSTLVVAEVPCHPKDISTLLTDANKAAAWSAMLDTGFLRKNARATKAVSFGHPVAYTMPKIGWKSDYETAKHKINEFSDLIVGIEFGYRGRFSFMTFYDQTLDLKLAS